MSIDLQNAKATVHVAGLDETINKDVLTAAFIPFGDIVSVMIPTDEHTGAPRGFAFVQFQDENDAAEAIANMDYAEIYSRTIRAVQAKSGKLAQAQSLGTEIPGGMDEDAIIAS